MKIKTIIILVLGVWMSATTAQATPVSQSDFSTEELAFAFQNDNIHFTQGDMMCSEEMKSTQGEWGLGFLTSVVIYSAQHINGGWSLKGAIRSGVQGEIMSYGGSFIGLGSYSPHFLGDSSWWTWWKK